MTRQRRAAKVRSGATHHEPKTNFGELYPLPASFMNERLLPCFANQFQAVEELAGSILV